jgi:exodeoxyribonuclease V alpha subunit
VKIFKAYGDKSIAVVTENPYKLADDIYGIGFATADKIAQEMGFDKECYHRCRSGVFYVLNDFANDGHCCVAFEELVEKAAVMLEIDYGKLAITADFMAHEKELIRERPNMIMYLPPFYYSEVGVAKRLRSIMTAPRKPAAIDIEASITRTEKTVGIEYDDIQRGAIRAASAHKALILTGSPGTGKTTTTKGIIAAFAEQGLDILLAAPTGRAAKRLSEMSGKEAKTIHRLLECRPQGYGRNSDNPLDGGVLIVDECSMIDIILMYNLLKAVPDEMIVVFIGDADQLPSVCAGNVLRDMIASGVVPTVKLTRIYRQAQTSLIITNAHRINKGEFPNLKGGKQSDFFFIEE